MATGAVVFETTDRDEAHHRLLGMYVEHDLRIASRRPDFGCHLRVAPSDDMTLAAVDFDNDVVIDAPPMDDCFQINVSRHGRCRVRQSSHVAEHLEDATYIMRPGEPLLMDWFGGTEHYAMKIPEQLIRERVARLAGRDAVDDLAFPLSFPTAEGLGAAFRASVSHVFAELSRPDGVAQIPAARRELQSSLITQFLCAAPGDVSRLLQSETATDYERTARQVADFIDNHPTLDIAVADLTAFAEVGVRTLQRAFSEAFDLSPSGYLRRARLRRVNADLRDGRGSVGDVAATWGFYNPGRFARHYRELFGETPSATLGVVN